MDDATKPSTIILGHETWQESAKRDATSVVAAWALILPGYLLGSGALQWLGAVIFMIIILVRASGVRKQMTMTLEEAREKIDAMLEAWK